MQKLCMVENNPFSDKDKFIVLYKLLNEFYFKQS